VDDRGLRQPVGEAKLEDVADARLDRRAGDLAVEAPRPRRAAGPELPVHLAGVELDGDDLPPGRGLGRVERVGVRRAPVRRRPVHHGTGRVLAVLAVSTVRAVTVRVGGGVVRMVFHRVLVL
jgi:hypothetical protein